MVSFEAGDKRVTGTIVRMLPDDEAKVKTEAGVRYRVPLECMKLVVSRTEDVDDDGSVTESDEFSQYPVNWDQDRVNFVFKVNGVKFNGWWRKRGPVSYAIDIYATMENGKNLSVDGLSYQHDPRENMKTLNSDICARVNKWFHFNEADAVSIEKLRKRADEPVVHLYRLETLDRLILKLKEFRDTAVRCGGDRFIQLEGDRPDDPRAMICVNFTAQALVLEGKVPNLYSGAIYDNVGSSKKGDPPARAIVPKPTPGNVEALVAQLVAARERGDQDEARKIRGVLRKMGHRGGARSSKGKEE